MPSSPAAAVSSDRPLRGIGYMLIAGLLFVMLDSTAKWLTQTHSPVQVLWARYAGHMVILAAYLVWLGLARSRSLLATESPGGQCLRGLLLALASLLAYLSLRELPLLQVYVFHFGAPLLVTLLAMPLLGERVDAPRGLAVMVGFVGVLVAVGPVDWRAQPMALLPLGMAFCFALYQLTTRRFGRHDHPLASLWYAGLAGALASSIALPFFWTPIGLAELPLFLGIGLIGATSQLALILAMRHAPASLASPFLYVQIVWASLFGFVLFGDLPPLTTYLGATLIIAAGIFLASRKH
ncbi:DMT family transporter [Halomonas heilongjiangensis]|uniref:EamA/RhaT family transporter n=1 Tax=Halomonas heilongjiangensis TaxID=1387883 RepID=A0A2N7TH24_9GAMM|nr:DMT family transporter [Halomonas heilongjiangensis]PMR67495.1 EamA/RhaT family transporter [Halomonas heilongjiangensis]PXX87061.1 S-adenosylmethionine uptake transporter [Halomonas heilongjiangensis]